MTNNNYHEPVLVQKIIEFAPLNAQARVIDATLGTGGHTLELIKRGAEVLGIDADKGMLEVAEKRLRKACPTPNREGWGSFRLIQGNFKDVQTIAKSVGWEEVDAVLFDLGTSNLQLTSSLRGFSFANPEAPLDMRIDPESQAVKGSDLLNVLRKDQLMDLFKRVLGIRESRLLTQRVLAFRETRTFSTVGNFLGVCAGIKGKRNLHLATLPFLALRIAVNSELENLKEALPKAFSLLKKGGRLMVISFHSGEDALVKDFFEMVLKEGLGEVLTPKPLMAEGQEVAQNPKARSAKLRVLQKI